jgi:hypothetical protein
MMETGSGYLLNSGVLHGIAKQAYERTVTAPSDTAQNQNDALTAVLFAAATLEAFVMELALTAEMGAKLSHTPSPVASLAGVLNEAESFHVSVKLKYILAKVILSGQPYDKGRQPYQDFDLLFAIRDAIVHYKPDNVTQNPHKIVAALAGRGLCEPEQPHVKSSWLHQITTRAVARWACNVVHDMVASLREHFPEDSEKSVNPFMLMAFNSESFDGVD